MFIYGIETLLNKHIDWLSGRRVGLIAHPASVTSDGQPVPEVLHNNPRINLTALYGPEHGYMGLGGAGEHVGDTVHETWGIPIYSLYGETLKPTAEMMEHIDTLVLDLQDLGVRAYTYVSTLRYVLEAAAEYGKEVIVTDRPIPFAECVDGPMLDTAFESFVGCIPSPVVYGMTMGETALWLNDHYNFSVSVKVASMEGYHRSMGWPIDGVPYVRPSPAIKDAHCARCFPITVFFEALPVIDHARKTDAPFQNIGHPDLKAEDLCQRLTDYEFAGIHFATGKYTPDDGRYKGIQLPALHLDVTNPATLKPIAIAIAIVYELQKLLGIETLWNDKETRKSFFDKLMGTDSVRIMLDNNMDQNTIIDKWQRDETVFSLIRKSYFLYND